MSVTPVQSTVFKASNGRRYVTLEGACRASARHKVISTYRKRGWSFESYQDPGGIDWADVVPVIDRLARLYKRSTRHAMMEARKSDQHKGPQS